MGGVGLINAPTARFSNDGEFAVGISTESPFNRLYAKMQFFPWLETVLRYTEAQYVSYNIGSAQTWKDKGLDAKFRLTSEGQYMPAIALGFHDIGGQGAYSSEYIVGSKRISNFDFTFGLGWGRLGGFQYPIAADCHFPCIKNPRSIIDDDYELRGYGAKQGGALNLSRLFGGNFASFFGGIEYLTPIPNLSLKAEYDSANYKLQLGKKKVFYKPGNVFEVNSKLNLALNYSYKVSKRDTLDLSLGYMRGNTYYANIAIHTNFNTKRPSAYTGPKEILNKPYLEPYSDLTSEWKKYLSDLIMWQLGNVGLVTQSIIFNDNELIGEITQGTYREPTKAVELALRVLGNNSPKNIDKITIINVDQGIETFRASIDRDVLVKTVAKGPLDEKLLEFNDIETLSENAFLINNDYLYPNFYWNVKPNLRGTLQHQVKFYFWQLEALFHGEYSINRNLLISADYGVDIANSFDEYDYHIPDGELHHVRQDRRLYLTEGESGMRRLALDYLVDLHPDVKASFSAGYLEWMFGGYGGEILYMPRSRNWALGMDAYWVKQRDFDGGFGFQEYETVTGFLNFYYDIPFYDMRFIARYGKFLGKDKGMTLDFSRRFATGARFGGMVALTDCDAVCVGEGSFNKWIYFSIPMDLFTEGSTRRKSGFGWAPLTKDAGTKVEPGCLYCLMKDSTDEVDSIRRKSWSMKKILSGFGTSPKIKA